MNPITFFQSIKSAHRDTGIPYSRLVRRARIAMDKGLSISYCVDNGLFELGGKELTKYLDNSSLRLYVEDISQSKNARAIDVYRQIRRARKEFGISFISFKKFNLFNAGDAALKKRARINDRRREELYDNLASAMGVSVEEAISETERVTEKFSITASSFYRKRLYCKTDEEIEKILLSERTHRDDAIAQIAKKLGCGEEDVKKEIKRCHVKFGIPRGDYLMMRAYELDDATLETYGNIMDSSTLNRHLNDRSAVEILSDKYLFGEYFGEFTKRKHWVNRDTTLEDFEQFAKGLDEAFCKPIDGSLGRGAEILDLRDADIPHLYEELLKKPKLLFEERVSQHGELDEFYDGSINTVRLFTVLVDDEFCAFASFIRFGANGSLADNVAAGGIGCGIDVETGTICTPAMDHDGDFHETHPNSGKRFEGFRIPNWDMALDVAERALRKNPDLNYVGWDLAIRDDDVVLIEGNSRPDIGICQAFFNYRRQGIRPSYERFLDAGAKAAKSRSGRKGANRGKDGQGA